MTPTVGRMVAAYGKNYSKPIKWFSIAQFFRAENPQKGRGREFFQLNADIFGDESVYSDFEVISLAIDILKAFKADENMFTVRINNRKFTDYYFTQHLGVEDKNLVQSIVRVIDASPKKDRAWFEESIASLSSDSSLVGKLDEYLAISAEKIASYKNESEGAAEITALFDMLKASNLDKYCVFDPYMARGFDYYTGMVFEVFDKNPNNNRSLFGGGRYDDLLDIFDQPKVPAAGFAPGDMTMRIFLEQWNLLSSKNVFGVTSYYIPVISDACRLNVLEVANKLRNEGLNSVRVGFKEESISKALSFANKNHIDKVVILGDDEYKKGIYKVKSMETGQEDSFDFA
jgi:histidyl-tRNA synthetase